MEEYIGSSEAEDDDDAERDINLDKQVHEETSDSESEQDEEETFQNLHGRDNISLPLDRSSYRARTSYDRIPTSECL